MNYIGSKLSLLGFLEKVYREIADGTEKVFTDMFAGTGAVGRLFKKLGLRVIANDLQYYAFILNKAYLELNEQPTFNGLRDKFRNEINKYKALSANADSVKEVLFFINNLPGKKGFIAQNYSPIGNRFYYTQENAEKTDAIRQAIDEWKHSGLITEQEYFYILCSLIEAIDSVANTACVYEAYLKNFKRTATKSLKLKPLELVNHVFGCKAYNMDSNKLVNEIETDILYLDPPYNERQYSSNYHMLDTIALYDNPQIKGITGMRDNYNRSLYCNKRKVKEAFKELILKAKTKHILLSYNDEGLMNIEDVYKILSLRGEPKTFKTKYNRFKADNGREYKRDSTIEFIHYVKVTKS